jgi:hypothetical protein
MQQSATPYDLREDYREDRQTYLRLVLLAALILGGMTFVAISVTGSVARSEVYGLWAGLALCMFVSQRLNAA